MLSNEYQNIIPYVTKISLTLWILLNHAILQEGNAKHSNSIHWESYSLNKISPPGIFSIFQYLCLCYRSYYPSSLGADRQMLAKMIYWFCDLRSHLQNQNC